MLIWHRSALGSSISTRGVPVPRCVFRIYQAAAFSTSTARRSPPLTDPPHAPRPFPTVQAKRVAVLGGGITGLAAAHELTSQLPDAEIVLYEAKNKLGGWIDTERIEVGDGHTLFEWGPRTLRSNLSTPGNSSFYTVRLIDKLKLHDDVITISPTSPAAYNRYLYYPDHLVRLPTPRPNDSLWTTLSGMVKALDESLFDDALGGVLGEPRVPVRERADESLGDFVTRRFGRPLTDNILSAVMHGIYAGDVYKLSAMAVIPTLWSMELKSKTGWNFGISGEIAGMMWRREKSYLQGEVDFMLESRLLQPDDQVQQHRRVFGGNLKAMINTYTMKHGLGQIVSRLQETLRRNPKVQIKSMTSKLAFNQAHKKFSIFDSESKNDTPKSEGDQFDYVISTLSPEKLRPVLSTSKARHPSPPYTEMLSQITNTAPAVSVMVVNLYYAEPDLVPVEGFGYLIPRSVPLDQNPERALGVIFGSQISQSGPPHDELGNPLKSTRQDTAPGTKLGVMLGGHWWDGWSPTDIPDEETAIAMAQSVLRRHLGITATPVIAKARFSPNAIPQHTVGYYGRMANLHQSLKREFDGRLKLAGPAFQGGVGVNDCVMAATKMAFAVREGLDGWTGLEGFERDPSVGMVRRGRN